MPVVEGRSVGRTIVVVRKPVLKKRYRRRQAGYRRCRYMASEGTIGLRMSRRCGGYGLSSAGSTGEEEGAAALGFAVVFAPCVFVQSGTAGGRTQINGCGYSRMAAGGIPPGGRYGKEAGGLGGRGRMGTAVYRLCCGRAVMSRRSVRSRKLTCDFFARDESYSLSSQRSSGNLPVQR